MHIHIKIHVYHTTWAVFSPLPLPPASEMWYHAMGPYHPLSAAIPHLLYNIASSQAKVTICKTNPNFLGQFFTIFKKWVAKVNSPNFETPRSGFISRSRHISMKPQQGGPWAPCSGDGPDPSPCTPPHTLPGSSAGGLHEGRIEFKVYPTSWCSWLLKTP